MKSFYENNTVLGIVKLFLPWYCKNKYKYSTLCLVVFHVQYTIFTAMQESKDLRLICRQLLFPWNLQVQETLRENFYVF